MGMLDRVFRIHRSQPETTKDKEVKRRHE
jgi:hypothetical protein